MRRIENKIYYDPGGSGGILWVLSVLGGFIIDTVLIYGERATLVGYYER